MSHINLIQSRLGRSRASDPIRWLRRVLVVVLMASLPFAGTGCSPELVVGALIVASVVSATQSQRVVSPPTPNPPRVLAESSAPVTHTRPEQMNPLNRNTLEPPQPPRPGLSLMPIEGVESALRAYKDLRWDQADRVLKRAISEQRLSASDMSLVLCHT